MIDLRQGDCLEVMRTLPDESVHACVTDPPYGLAFMGKKWDYDVPTEEVWREVLRVLKPGGFLLSFSGTRTYHRMVVRIEDAGFEIRDMIQWLYGSGFPKSHNVSKAIDREAGAERERVRPLGAVARAVKDGTNALGGSWQEEPWETAPATDAAKQWDGWGSALKPANEPICVARKPLIGTIAQNVLAHGCGGLNIDGCRIGTDDDTARKPSLVGDTSTPFGRGEAMGGNGHQLGRWPANVVHDGSDEVLALFPQTGAGGFLAKRNAQGFRSDGLVQGDTPHGALSTDSGSAARFFYCAKAGQSERDKGVSGPPIEAKRTQDGGDDTRGHPTPVNRNFHPTVKPVDLMRWLVRLVCPPGAVVIDPFMGSGTTGVACRLEGFGFIGIDRDEDYVRIAQGRIDAETPSLFAGAPE